MVFSPKDKEENPLEQGGGAATEAANLLFTMMDEAIAATGNELEFSIHGDRETIRSLYRKCCGKIKTMATAGEKAGFLVMGILKYTFNLALPLMMVSLEDMLHGDYHMVENAKRFRELIDNDPYLAGWKEKAASYRKLLESVGMDIKGLDYSDLSVITDPLINALTFYQNPRLKIYQARTGKRSTARPVLMTEVCKFQSEKEFVDAISA